MKLQCKNVECESRDHVIPMFKVSIMVDQDGDPCESASGIDGDYFTCCHCGDSAEWVKDDGGLI